MGSGVDLAWLSGVLGHSTSTLPWVTPSCYSTTHLPCVHHMPHTLRIKPHMAELNRSTLGALALSCSTILPPLYYGTMVLRFFLLCTMVLRYYGTSSFVLFRRHPFPFPFSGLVVVVYTHTLSVPIQKMSYRGL